MGKALKERTREIYEELKNADWGKGCTLTALDKWNTCVSIAKEELMQNERVKLGSKKNFAGQYCISGKEIAEVWSEDSVPYKYTSIRLLVNGYRPRPLKTCDQTGLLIIPEVAEGFTRQLKVGNQKYGFAYYELEITNGEVLIDRFE